MWSRSSSFFKPPRVVPMNRFHPLAVFPARCFLFEPNLSVPGSWVPKVMSYLFAIATTEVQFPKLVVWTLLGYNFWYAFSMATMPMVMELMVMLMLMQMVMMMIRLLYCLISIHRIVVHFIHVIVIHPGGVHVIIDS